MNINHLKNKIMEKQNLKLDYIKLTPGLIETINSLQTGGSMHFEAPLADEYFNNSSLKDLIGEITEIADFLVSVYEYEDKLFAENQFARMLINLRCLKIVLNGFAAPVPEKQI
jgi:hypothetical protein